MSRIKWTKQLVLDEINNLNTNSNGNFPNTTYVKDNYNPLYTASKRYFGSWENALKEVDISLKEVNEKYKQMKREQEKQVLLEQLKEYKNSSLKELRENNKQLYVSLCSYFGSFQKATKLADIDYSSMLQESKPQITREEMIAVLRRDYEKGTPINDSSFRKNHKFEYNRVVTLFGSFKEFVFAAGIDYYAVSKKKGNGYWTKNRIIKEIKKLHQNGINLSKKNMTENYSDLVHAGCSHFGNWEKSLIASDVDYNQYRMVNRWTKEKILKELKDFSNQHAPNDSSLRKHNYPLIKAIYRHFSHLSEALHEIGIDYEEVTLKKEKGYWTEDSIKETILKYYKQGQPLNSMYAKTYYGGLYSTTTKIFGSWENAVNACGLNFDDFREDINTTRYCGYVFERMVKELLTELGIPFEKKVLNDLKPDFILKNYHVLDAKLSEWTINASPTVENYFDHFKFITLVYMRKGVNTPKDRMINSRTRLISVDLYIKQLPNHRHQYYYDKIEQINKYLENIHDVPYEIIIRYKDEIGDVEYWAEKLNMKPEYIVRYYREKMIHKKIEQYYYNLLTIDGITLTYKEWAEKLGLVYKTVLAWRRKSVDYAYNRIRDIFHKQTKKEQ